MREISLKGRWISGKQAIVNTLDFLVITGLAVCNFSYHWAWYDDCCVAFVHAGFVYYLYYFQ
jgi:hypothetical protein